MKYAFNYTHGAICNLIYQCLFHLRQKDSRVSIVYSVTLVFLWNFEEIHKIHVQQFVGETN